MLLLFVCNVTGKKVEKLTFECPEIPENAHPHLVRKSRAMHMYQAGMPLEMLAQFLGHDDPLTALVYARADNETKGNW